MALSKIQTADMLDTPVVGRRNLIINGAMHVAQRGTKTGVAVGYGGADRFQFARGGAAEVTLSRDTDVPTGQGFTSSQKVDVTTVGDMSGSGHYAMIRQKIEGLNLQHLLYGTSSAKKLTLQFWVRSPKTGTHIVELYHGDAAYFNCQQYTIATANTWQKFTMTFDGYQTTAFDNDSGIGVQLAWWLGASTTYNSGTHTDNSWHNVSANRAVGQVNVMDNTANNFYLTGVQLEVGDTATDFEHRSFGEELTLCQRYFNAMPVSSGVTYLTNGGNIPLGNGFHFPTTMRATPQGTVVSNVAAGNSNSGSLAQLSAHGGRYKCNMSVSAGSISRTDNCTFEAEL